MISCHCDTKLYVSDMKLYFSDMKLYVSDMKLYFSDMKSRMCDMKSKHGDMTLLTAEVLRSFTCRGHSCERTRERHWLTTAAHNTVRNACGLQTAGRHCPTTVC